MASRKRNSSKAFEEQATNKKKRRLIFSKRLTHTDVSKRLAIPTKCLYLLPRFCGGDAVELPVIDSENGHRWTFICSVRQKGAHRKPVFQQGWLKFVVAKSLHVDDKVSLYETQEDGIKILGSWLPRSLYVVEIDYN